MTAYEMRISDWSSDVCSSDLMMGPENCGVAVLMSGLDYERAVLAVIQIGIMQACLDVVLPYVRERKQFGQPIGRFQLMQAKIADMYVALNSARAYVYAVARSCHAGKATRFDAAGAILLASENAVRSEEHTSELQSLMRISYAVFCFKKKKEHNDTLQRHRI